MKVILYMGITANGFIAGEGDDTSFVEADSWKSFENVYKKAGNIIMGRRTFELSIDDGTFPYPDAFNIVMSHKNYKNEWGEDKVLITDKSPQWVLTKLEEKGFKEAFLAGGGTLNSSFMKDGLIDEVYLDIEPIAFGKGIPLFAPDSFEVNLKLLDSKNLNSNTIQLHYAVKR